MAAVALGILPSLSFAQGKGAIAIVPPPSHDNPSFLIDREVTATDVEQKRRMDCVQITADNASKLEHFALIACPNLADDPALALPVGRAMTGEVGLSIRGGVKVYPGIRVRKGVDFDLWMGAVNVLAVVMD